MQPHDRDPRWLLRLGFPPAASDAEEARRGRLVVDFSLLLAVVAVAFGAIYWVLDSPHGAAAAFLGAVSALTTVAVLRRAGSTSMSATWLCLNLSGVLLVIGWFNGGLQSAAIEWFVLLPVLGVHLGGPRTGYVVAAVACLIVAGAYVATVSGVTFPFEVAEPHRPLVAGLGLTGLVLMVLSLALIYESTKDRAIAEIRETNCRLDAEVRQHEATAARLRQTHRRYVDSARLAGKADVARSVLHTVGNVLNSANVSAGILMERVQSVPVPALTKSASLLRDELRHLPSARLARLPEYLDAVAAALAVQRDEIRDELASLQRSIDDVKAVVSLQEAHTGHDAIEAVSLEGLLDEALDLSIAEGSRVEVTRQYAHLPEVELDRHKVFHVVMNLLSNAQEALAGSGGHIAVRTRAVSDSEVAIEVEDDGCGIEPDALDKIFGIGFTTKTQGSGFGLHSSACAAAEMAGRLSAHSAGPKAGAVFTLVLPKRPPLAGAAARPAAVATASA